MSTNAIGRSFSVRDGGFLKNTGNLEELAGSEFLLAIGERALSGRGPVRIVSTESGFDLRIGPATLNTFDGLLFSAQKTQGNLRCTRLVCGSARSGEGQAALQLSA